MPVRIKGLDKDFIRLGERFIVRKNVALDREDLSRMRPAILWREFSYRTRASVRPYVGATGGAGLIKRDGSSLAISKFAASQSYSRGLGPSIYRAFPANFAPGNSRCAFDIAMIFLTTSPASPRIQEERSVCASLLPIRSPVSFKLLIL